MVEHNEELLQRLNREQQENISKTLEKYIRDALTQTLYPLVVMLTHNLMLVSDARIQSSKEEFRTLCYSYFGTNIPTSKNNTEQEIKVAVEAALAQDWSANNLEQILDEVINKLEKR